MKSLSHIKETYAQERRFKSWDHFCLVANDDMFIRAVDEIALLYAATEDNVIAFTPRKSYANKGISKRNRYSRNPFTVGFSK